MSSDLKGEIDQSKHVRAHESPTREALGERARFLTGKLKEIKVSEKSITDELDELAALADRMGFTRRQQYKGPGYDASL